MGFFAKMRDVIFKALKSTIEKLTDDRLTLMFSFSVFTSGVLRISSGDLLWPAFWIIISAFCGITAWREISKKTQAQKRIVVNLQAWPFQHEKDYQAVVDAIRKAGGEVAE